MATTDAESYLNQLVGRMVRIKQIGGDDLYLNVLSLNAIGMVVQDSNFEYFLPWATVSYLRLATAAEQSTSGSPQLRRRLELPVLNPNRDDPGNN